MGLVFNMVGGGGSIRLSSISIVTQPSKTSYNHGESFATAGMVVRATYSNGATKNVTNYTYSPSGALKFTNTQVTITYTEGGISKTASQAISVGAPVAITQSRNFTNGAGTIKGVAKYNDYYLLVGNDASYNIHGEIVASGGSAQSWKINSSGTYPASGILVRGSVVDIPLTDKYGGTLYKDRYKAAMAVSSFLSKGTSFTIFSTSGVRLNCAAVGSNSYAYFGGKNASGQTYISYSANTAAVNSASWQTFGSSGEVIDISCCADSDGTARMSLLTDKGHILIKTLGPSGATTAVKTESVGTGAKKAGMIPVAGSDLYRCAYTEVYNGGYTLRSIYGGGGHRRSSVFAGSDCTILGVGAVGNYAVVVFADASGNGKIYVNEDGTSGAVYSLGTLAPTVMCSISDGIAVVCATSTSNAYAIKEIHLQRGGGNLPGRPSNVAKR